MLKLRIKIDKDGLTLHVHCTLWLCWMQINTPSCVAHGISQVLSALVWKRLYCTRSGRVLQDLLTFLTHFYYSSYNKKSHSSIQSPNLKIGINETHKMWKRPPYGEWSREVLKDTVMAMWGFSQNQRFSADHLTHTRLNCKTSLL